LRRRRDEVLADATTGQRRRGQSVSGVVKTAGHSADEN